jgi:hypothetical protein|eukprot:COSAG06_NODE_18598_length_878_cov_1.193838_2_plen_75_part_00
MLLLSVLTTDTIAVYCLRRLAAAVGVAASFGVDAVWIKPGAAFIQGLHLITPALCFVLLVYLLPLLQNGEEDGQ